ncbi:MAG TPA: sialidase family protein [Gaiellaceae bacterium]|nr:sialidase family protein [Gaiellaceae bacterium]
MAVAAAVADGAIARSSLAREALIVVAVTAIGASLVYHFFVRTIHNGRPLAGRNVAVALGEGTQSEPAFAVDPARPRIIFGALGASGELVGNPGSFGVFGSTDGGATWRKSPSPAIPGKGCFFAAPRTAIDKSGREFLAFMAGPCAETLTPHLVIASRASSTAPWGPVTRIVPRVGRWGFDDGPALALDEHTGRVYLTWVRALDRSRIALVVSASNDHGRTWTAPVEVSRSLVDPHLPSIAVGANGDVYLAGIDGSRGLWVTRSTDGAKSFAAPHSVARLFNDPARDQCALSNDGPLPFELTSCIGPNPTLLVRGKRVYVIYDDIGPNRTQDVFSVGLDSKLKIMFRAQVNPPDTGKTEQFFPAAAIDAQSGVVSACWYDTTFDPNKHRSWFTCSTSPNGLDWGLPLRAAAEPTMTVDLYGTLPISASLVAADGQTRAFWPDGRNYRRGMNVYTAPLPEG